MTEPLIVANTTRSKYLLNVRVPEIHKVVRFEIPSGEQRRFPLEMTSSQRAGVVAQLERYGARTRASVHGKLSSFTGLVYATDKPLTEDEIVSANKDQLDTAQERSVEQATRSGLAADQAWREGKNRRGRRLAKSTGVEVFKKESAGGKEEPMMSIEVSEQGETKTSRLDPAVRDSLQRRA